MNIKLYVEGGGDRNKALQTECRRGFSEFIAKAGFAGRMPRVVACGGRRQAYDSFRTAHREREPNSYPMLLVDSEEPVVGENPWVHVKMRQGDGWEYPEHASNDQLHLMVQTLEAWFYADEEALAAYFGHEFQGSALSRRSDVEQIPKAELFAGLLGATRHCPKGQYSKAAHSFKILARIDPAKVRTATHAARLLSALDRLSNL